MPHQLQPADYTTPLPGAAMTPLVAAQTVAQTEATPRRYDAQTVQQIIALAEQMQTRHRETLSADEVENLGREIGVEPEFVRRALAQIEAPTQSSTAFVPVRPKRGSAKADLPLTRRQRAAVMVPAFIYALFTLFTLGVVSMDGFSGILLYLIVPAVLALCLGVKSKSKRVGALGGGLFGIAAMFSLVVNTTFMGHGGPSFSEFVAVLAVWLAVGTSLGLGGAVLRQGIGTVRRKRLRVRLVVETDDEKAEKAGTQTSDWV